LLKTKSIAHRSGAFPPRAERRTWTLTTAIGLLVVSAGCSAKLESDGLVGTGMAPPAPMEAPRAMPATDGGAAAAEAEAPVPAPTMGTMGLGGAAGASPPMADAGASATVPPTTPSPGEAGPPTPPPALVGSHCGEPPYQPLRLSARDIMAAPAAKDDLADVVVTFKHCPGQSFPLAAGGGTVLISTGIETWVRFAAPGYLPWLEGEILIPGRGAPIPIEATLVPVAIAPTLVPAWNTNSAVIYVEVQRGRAVETEACRSPSGVALSVKDHPEAVVRYRGKGANAGYEETMSATTEEGIALITNLLPPATTVELQADKADCTYVPAYGNANAAMLFPIVRTPLESGAITHQVFNPVR
jgi:hypothetical protein